METPNVIMIVVDALRKDYAKPLETRLKKMGFISYENAITPAPWTLPSHASIFTGLYPLFHAAHEIRNKEISNLRLRYKPLLTEQLNKLGYTNYLITANAFVSPFFGFDNFDHIKKSHPAHHFGLSAEELNTLRKIYNKFKFLSVFYLLRHLEFELLYRIMINYLSIKFHLPVERVYALLRKWPKEKGVSSFIEYLSKITLKTPFFLFMNIIEVHDPYFLGDDMHRLYINNIIYNHSYPNYYRKVREKYAEQVSYVSEKLIKLFKIFEEKNIFDNSLIIVVSDHGQLLGDHGRLYHGTFLFDELLRVPLLIKYPKEMKVNVIKEDKRKYISLVKLKPFILGIVENTLNNDSVLYSDTVFAESYGIFGLPDRLKKTINEGRKRKIEYLEKYRIAIYHRNFKGIFNVNDWEFETIESYDDSIKVTEDIVKDMKKKVVNFLRLGSLKKLIIQN